MIEIPGPYRWLGLIGRGGMGAVYEARDERLKRRVAIKRIPFEIDQNPVRRQRLRREAAALAQLNHPAIVQVYDLVQAEEGDWIVMELVEGPTLADCLSTGPLALPRLLAVGRQVAEGLAQAHARGILHRDLKTENVKLQRQPATVLPSEPWDTSERVKILDFGLAKILADDEGDTPLSVSGQIVGTYRAMSPEQIRGLPLDPRSDLFSLGVLLYEITTGERPFPGTTPLETLERITRHEHISARLKRPEIPRRLDALIDRLLEKSPEQRPASAAEVAYVLAEIAEDAADAGLDGSVEPSNDEPTLVSGEISARRSSTTRDDSSPGLRFPPDRRGGKPGRLTAGRVTAALLAVGGALGLFLAFGPEGSWLRSRDSRAGALEAAEVTADPTTLFRHGMALLERFDKPERLEQAVASFQKMLERHPGSAPAHAGLARAYWRQYIVLRDPLRLEQAVAVARRAVGLDEHLAFARVTLGLVLAESGQYEEAFSELEAALALEPANADAKGGLARAYELTGRLDEAIATAREAVELAGEDRILRDRLGALHYRAGHYTEAAAQFQESIELAPDGIYGYRNLAAVYHMQGRLGEAAEMIQRALLIQPEPSLYSNLGTLLFAQGLYPAAATAFEKALDLGGGHYYLYWANLADALRFTAGRESEANAAYRQAIALLRVELAAQPESSLLRSRLALFQAKRGACDLARQELLALAEEALAEEAGRGHDGQEAAELYRIAVAHELCGERRRAMTALAAALDAGYPRHEIEADQELFALRSDPSYHRLMSDRLTADPPAQPPVAPSPTTISGSR